MLDQQNAGAAPADRLDQWPSRTISSADSPAAGSSSSRKLGRSISARAISMKRSSLCWSRSARTSARPSRPTIRKAAQRRGLAALPRRAGGAAATEQRFTNVPRPSMVAADHDVLQHRGLADDARRLERAGDAARRRGVSATPAAAEAVADVMLALLRPVVAGDHVEDRRLAAAVGADQPVDLAGRGCRARRRRPRARRRSSAPCHASGWRRSCRAGRARTCVRARRRQRHDRADLLLQRLAAPEIQQRRDAARRDQHDASSSNA